MKTPRNSETVAGYPAFRVLRFRLRDIGPFRDTGEVTLDPKMNLLLGDNAAGKTTLLRCLALASVGVAAANELVEKASGYVRKGAERGSFEVLFEMLPRPDASPVPLPYFATGLEITDGEKRFVPIKQVTLSPPDLFSHQRTMSSEELSDSRSKGAPLFGFVAGYGAVRTFTDNRYAIQPELKKRENEWVLSLFKPEAWLASPEALSKLLRGDTSNIEEGPVKALLRKVVAAMRSSLEHLVPDVSEFYYEGPNDLQLNQTDLNYGDLSDGYRSLFALVGHLLRCALRVRDWKEDPTKLHGIVLIDELDLHLHPAWQRHVVEDFRKAFPNMQLITSTHSPMVVGALDASSVFVLNTEAGETKIVPLGASLTESNSMKAWRADQILTGPGFKLDTSISTEAEKWHAEFEKLWSLAERKRSPAQSARLRTLADRLNRDVPKAAESPSTREALRLFEEWTREHLKSRKPEEIDEIVKEVRAVLEVEQGGGLQ